jgi:hypothetical protein
MAGRVVALQLALAHMAHMVAISGGATVRTDSAEPLMIPSPRPPLGSEAGSDGEAALHSDAP